MIKQITVTDLCSVVAGRNKGKRVVRQREVRNTLLNLKSMFVLKSDTKAPFSLLLVYFSQDPFFSYLLWRKA